MSSLYWVVLGMPDTLENSVDDACSCDSVLAIVANKVIWKSL